MKKFIAAILLVCYLAVTCGVVVNFHYCMDRLASTQFFGAESKVCGKCGMHTDSSNGCCRDEVRIIKMEDDQKLNVAGTFDFLSFVAIAQKPSVFIDGLPQTDSPSRHNHNHSPPLLHAQDTYLLNCVFRI